MTGKEIIIDGVDVSECQNYNSKNKKCTIPCRIGKIKCTSLNCSDIEDCYFKQFKRKEQALGEIEKIVKQTCGQRCTNECLGTRKHCGYGSVLNIINKVKDGYFVASFNMRKALEKGTFDQSVRIKKVGEIEIKQIKGDDNEN